MKNTEKLYIAKEASLRGLLSKVLGSRGQLGNFRTGPGGITRSTPQREVLSGASGLKGLTRPKLTQFKNPPNLGSDGNGISFAGIPGGNTGNMYVNTLKNPMVSTPLAKLLQALGLGAGGAGVGYAGYKGLEADDNLGEPYNYKGNPNR